MLVDACVAIHTRAADLAARLRGETGGGGDAAKGGRQRRVYVTPRAFLDLVQMFAARLSHRCSEQRAAIYRLTLGIHRLENVEETVVRLRDQMTETQPILAENARSTQELLAQLAKQSESVAEKRAIVSREEQVVRGKAEQVAMVQ